MATVYIQKPGDVAGVKRKGEPLARPYVVLKDGTAIPYMQWLEQGNPT